MMLQKERLAQIRYIFEKTLLHDIVPFWIKHSIDTVNGGYYNYLDRDGSVLSTDKSVWLQNRAVWFFAKLYNNIDQNTNWLEAAKYGYNFIKTHCFDDDGSMFFLVDQEGRKLRKRRYWFTETFGVLGFGEYAKATQEKEPLDLAKRTYQIITDLYQHPEKRPSKIFVANRQLKNLTGPMLLLSTTQVMRKNSTQSQEIKAYNEVIDACIEDVLTNFVHPEHQVLLETVAMDGSILDSPEGRTINPGHAIETSWFLMQEGLYRGDGGIVEQGLKILMWSLERGWDEKYGGLFSFIDLYDKPSDHVEWDMKYWWPHTETMYALLLAHVITKEEKYMAWYEDVHAWTFGHFPDYEYGEWYGYLHRDGSVSLSNKGSHWKGTLHTPRLLIQGINLIDSCLSNENNYSNFKL